jgi:alpha-mannosidase
MICSIGKASTAAACWRTPSTIRCAAITARPSRIAILGTWGNFRAKTFHKESLLAVGYGDGGGGVTPEMLEREAQLVDFPAVPALKPVRVEDVFARMHEMPASEGPDRSGRARSISNCTARR